MRMVFADSYFYLALVNDRDEGHDKAVDFARSFRGRTLTTEWALTEVGDGLAAPRWREKFRKLLDELLRSPRTIIVPAEHQLFVDGSELFFSRPDKSWSLTDCISFVVMQEHGVGEALTGDRHFAQAGFVPLLA